MAGLDHTKQFVPLRIAVLTVSDTRTLETDKSGDTLVERIARDGHVLVDRAIVLNLGKVLVEGKPADVVRNPEVISAYLGDRHAVGA